MSNKHYTSLLANYTATFNEIPLQDSLVGQVRRVLLDYFCAAISGSSTEVSKKLYNYLLKSDGVGSCQAIGYEKGLSLKNAALINGTNAHCLDFDDGHTGGSFHPGTVVIPAVMSCAQALNRSSEKIIRAVLIGYDISARISSAMHPSSRKRGFHNTPVAGIFGAVASVSYLYGLDKEKTQQALGVAGSFASGLFAFLGSGSEIKRLHPGKAAHDAILAVELVNEGISGPTEVLEDQNGVFQAFAGGDISVDNLLDGLGEKFEIMNVYFKPYPCCRHLHSAIDAIYEIKELQKIDISQIAKVNIGVNRMASLHNHKSCHTLLDAQMSLPFAASIAIVHDSLNLKNIHPDNASQDVWDICEKVYVYEDQKAEEIYPQKRAAFIEIKLLDGKTITHSVDNPLGEPSKPMSNELLEKKFLDNCSPIIGQEKAEDFVNNLRDWPHQAKETIFFKSSVDKVSK